MGDIIQFKKREPAHRKPAQKKAHCTHWTTEVHKSKWMPWPVPHEQEKPDHE